MYRLIAPCVLIVALLTPGRLSAQDLTASSAPHAVDGVSTLVDMTFNTSWLCLGGSWTGIPGAASNYRCPGTVATAVNYAAIEAGKSAATLAEIKASFDRMVNAIDKNTAAAEATQKAIQTQVESSNKLLYDAIIAKFAALPVELVTNKDFKDVLQKLKDDILTEVKGKKP